MEPAPPSKPPPAAKPGGPAGLGGPSLPSRHRAIKKPSAAGAKQAEGPGPAAKGPQLPPKQARDASSRAGRTGPSVGAPPAPRPAGGVTSDSTEHIEDIPVPRSRAAQPVGGFADLLRGLEGQGGVGGMLSQIASDSNTMDLLGDLLGGGEISSSSA